MSIKCTSLSAPQPFHSSENSGTSEARLGYVSRYLEGTTKNTNVDPLAETSLLNSFIVSEVRREMVGNSSTDGPTTRNESGLLFSHHEITRASRRTNRIK